MFRSAVASALAVVFSAGIVAGAFAQSKPAAPTAAATTEPAARAKWVAPIKGDATVQMIKTNSKHVGKEIVTNFKIKNISAGAIALFRIDEYLVRQWPEATDGDGRHAAIHEADHAGRDRRDDDAIAGQARGLEEPVEFLARQRQDRAEGRYQVRLGRIGTLSGPTGDCRLLSG